MDRLRAWLDRQVWLRWIRHHWRILLLALVALYLIAAAIIARAAFAQLPPTPNLRTAVRFVPLPAIRVDQSFIWMNEYLERSSYIDSFIKKTDQSNVTPEKTRDQVVDYLVETRLIDQLAKQQRVSVRGSDITAAYDQLAKQPGVGGAEQIEQVLRELYGMTPTAFKRLLGEQLLRERVEQQVFLHVKSRHILVATEADANRIVDEIKGGQAFEAEAQQFSQDGKTRDDGGSLGFVGRGSGLPKPLEDAVFALNPDDLPIIAKSDLGFHVVDTMERQGIIDANFTDWLGQQKHERSISVYLKTGLDWAQPKQR